MNTANIEKGAPNAMLNQVRTMEAVQAGKHVQAGKRVQVR